MATPTITPAGQPAAPDSPDWLPKWLKGLLIVAIAFAIVAFGLLRFFPQQSGLPVSNGTVYVAVPVTNAVTNTPTTQSPAVAITSCPALLISTRSLELEIQGLLTAIQQCWVAGDTAGVYRYVATPADEQLAQPYPVKPGPITVVRACKLGFPVGAVGYDFTIGDGPLMYDWGTLTGSPTAPQFLGLASSGAPEDHPSCPG